MARVGNNGAVRVPAGWTLRRADPPAKFLQLSELRKLRECQQVAAVCYRVNGNGIEFLLVETRNRRWTFPKGSAEPGLTHAQAAALEAFEEAGVHGRMEEASFTCYRRIKRGSVPESARSAMKDPAVNAHLCEVLWLGSPQESRRNRTWFTPAEAKRRLREDRVPEYAAELARVVDRAVSRIRRLHEEVTVVPTLPGGTEENPAGRSIGQERRTLQKVRFIDSAWSMPRRGVSNLNRNGRRLLSENNAG